MGQLPTWVRRRLRWSTTPRAWAERGASLALLLAAVGGWWLSRGWGWEPKVVLAALWLTALAYLVRREIIVLLGPVFFYEILRFSRRRVHGTRIIYAGILLATISYVWVAWSSSYRGLPRSLSAQAEMAATFFLAFFAIQMTIVGLVTPLMVAGSIADEKERRTLEFLLATDLRGREIALGKLAARVASVLLVLITGLPVLALLQFFGGIDPGELLAVAIVSLVSLYSVACLSVMMSSLARRGRDAILSTYVLIGGYLALSALAPLLGYTPLHRLDVTVAGMNIEGQDIISALHAGNPFVGLVSVLRQQEAGAAFAEVLRDVVTSYTVFHLAAGTLCLGWAVSRLRPVALAQAGENRGRSRSRRRRRLHPAIGNSPMRWKELFVEPGPRFHILVRLLVLLIVLLCFWPAVEIIANHWSDLTAAAFYGATNKRWVQYELNGWVRGMSGFVGMLLLLSVALRAAGSVTGERARQSLDDLLTTPLTNREIVSAKWLGSLLSPRRGWLWLGSVYAIGVATMTVSIVGVLLAILAWLCYAVFFASLGVWCSVRTRNTFQATALTMFLSIFAMGGHWAVTGLGCYLPLSFTRASGDLLEVTIPLQLGLTPPAVLGILPMLSLNELSTPPPKLLAGIILGSFGPFIFLLLGLGLRAVAVQHFAHKFSRTDRRRPEKRPPRRDDLPSQLDLP